jgi:6-pyruvoyltetrahydropterin/6-carboxytetrahydropterin synthase
MVTVTRKLEFDAGHRVMNHESKCATLHGHRYTVWVTAEEAATGLDRIGRVIDFSVLKEKIGGWIDHHWDHTCIISLEDRETLVALSKLPQAKPICGVPFNPTAENMATFLLHNICPILMDGTGIRITKVRVDETPNCYAEVELK